MSKEAVISRVLATELNLRHPDIFRAVRDVRHLDNFAYLLESASGQRFVVKIIPEPPLGPNEGAYQEWRSCWSPYDKEI